MDRADTTRPQPLLMVVQRGDEERYQLLRKLFQSQRVEVVLDRRNGDRRTPDALSMNGGNRRRGERRTDLPDTWVNLGFFVAHRQVKG